jgi:hypothetical protein
METALEIRKTALAPWIAPKCKQELRDNILIPISGPYQYFW